MAVDADHDAEYNASAIIALFCRPPTECDALPEVRCGWAGYLLRSAWQLAARHFAYRQGKVEAVRVGHFARRNA